jgi:hypothetical protein
MKGEQHEKVSGQLSPPCMYNSLLFSFYTSILRRHLFAAMATMKTFQIHSFTIELSLILLFVSDSEKIRLNASSELFTPKLSSRPFALCFVIQIHSDLFVSS